MAKLSIGSLMLRAGKALSAAILLFFAGLALGQEKDKPEEQQWFKRIDSRQLADLEKIVQKIHAKVSPSVVRILIPGKGMDEPQDVGTGVIVSPSGEVFTCAHFDLPPQTKVIVELADGSRVKGTMLGSVKKPQDGFYRAHDIGMIRLDEKREWPAAALGWPLDLDNGELCLAIGYPYVHKLGQPPLLRLGRVLPPGGYGTVRSSCRVFGGDSGGPLFDLQGRILSVAAHMKMSPRWPGTDYTAVEVFAKFRDRLRKGEEIVAERKLGRATGAPKYAWGAFEPAQDLAKTIAAALRTSVEILCDGKPTALGLIVEQDGWIVTKRSQLLGCRQLVCRLADGRRLAARIARGSRDHDLALLKIESTNLAVGKWAEAGAPRVGQLVASFGPDARPLHFGVVGGCRIANPGVKGYLPIDGKAATPKGVSGLLVTEVWKDRPDAGNLLELLKAGDIITHVDDVPTPTAEEYVRVRDKRLATPDALIGGRIKLTVCRGKENLEVFAPIVSTVIGDPFYWEECPRSLRRNGFPNVFTHDGGIAPEQCGGPVVGRSGEIVGINIARADEIQTLAIPSDVVRKVVAELKAKAEKK